MSIKLRRQEEREQIRTSTEKMKHCLIISLQIFYVTIVLCLTILWLKAVNEITARQTWTSLRKHDVIKVCRYRIFNIKQTELVSPTFKSWTVHKIIEYLTLGLLSSLWNICHSTTAYFFHPPCRLETPAIWQKGLTWLTTKTIFTSKSVTNGSVQRMGHLPENHLTRNTYCEQLDGSRWQITAIDKQTRVTEHNTYT